MEIGLYSKRRVRGLKAVGISLAICIVSISSAGVTSSGLQIEYVSQAAQPESALNLGFSFEKMSILDSDQTPLETLIPALIPSAPKGVLHQNSTDQYSKSILDAHNKLRLSELKEAVAAEEAKWKDWPSDYNGLKAEYLKYKPLWDKSLRYPFPAFPNAKYMPFHFRPCSAVCIRAEKNLSPEWLANLAENTWITYSTRPVGAQLPFDGSQGFSPQQLATDVDEWVTDSEINPPPDPNELHIAGSSALVGTPDSRKQTAEVLFSIQTSRDTVGFNCTCVDGAGVRTQFGGCTINLVSKADPAPSVLKGKYYYLTDSSPMAEEYLLFPRTSSSQWDKFSSKQARSQLLAECLGAKTDSPLNDILKGPIMAMGSLLGVTQYHCLLGDDAAAALENAHRQGTAGVRLDLFWQQLSQSYSISIKDGTLVIHPRDEWQSERSVVPVNVLTAIGNYDSSPSEQNLEAVLDTTADLQYDESTSPVYGAFYQTLLPKVSEAGPESVSTPIAKEFPDFRAFCSIYKASGITNSLGPIRFGYSPVREPDRSSIGSMLLQQKIIGRSEDAYTGNLPGFLPPSSGGSLRAEIIKKPIIRWTAVFSDGTRLVIPNEKFTPNHPPSELNFPMPKAAREAAMKLSEKYSKYMTFLSYYKQHKAISGYPKVEAVEYDQFSAQVQGADQVPLNLTETFLAGPVQLGSVPPLVQSILDDAIPGPGDRDSKQAQ